MDETTKKPATPFCTACASIDLRGARRWKFTDLILCAKCLEDDELVQLVRARAQAHATFGRPANMAQHAESRSATMRGERADELLEAAISLLSRELGIAPADAGRELLAGLARWFGIDFELETNRLLDRDDEG